MADIVLVQPKVGNVDSFRSDPALPLGLLYSSIYAAKDFNIKLIDQRLDKNWKLHLRQELKKSPLLVATTAMTGQQITHALEISKFVKQNSETPVVWGGIHATLLPKQTLENKNIDYAIIGEGELTLNDLAHSLQAQKTKSKLSVQNVKGLAYKAGDSILINPRREFVELSNDIPLHLVNIKNYLPKFKKIPTLYLESSRGCPNNCTFCYNYKVHGCRWRFMSAQKTFDLVRSIHDDYKIKGFYFVDDNFFADLNRVGSFTDLLINEKLDISWQSQGITVNKMLEMKSELLSKLSRTNLVRVSVGIESGSPRIRALLNKDADVKDIVSANRKFSRYPISIYGNVISGFPGETIADLKLTINLIYRLIKDNPYYLTSPVHNYCPYPGTSMYDLAIKSGFKAPDSIEGWSSVEFANLNVKYLSKQMSSIIPRLHLASYFMDGKFDEFDVSLLMKLLFKLYRPIADFRTKNLFFDIMPEYYIKKIISGDNN